MSELRERRQKRDEERIAELEKQIDHLETERLRFRAERDELANRIKTLREVAQYGLRAARNRNYYKSLEWTNIIADSYKAIPDAPEGDRIQGHKVDTVILDEVAELRRLALAFVDARGRYHHRRR